MFRPLNIPLVKHSIHPERDWLVLSKARISPVLDHVRLCGSGGDYCHTPSSKLPRHSHICQMEPASRCSNGDSEIRQPAPHLLCPFGSRADKAVGFGCVGEEAD